MNLCLSEASERFLRRYTNPNSLATYKAALHLLIQAFGDMPLRDVTFDDLDDWYAELSHRNLSPVTVAYRVKMVRAFFNWCIAREYMDSNPARLLPTRRPKVILRNKAIPESTLRQMLKLVKENRSPFLAKRNRAILALLVQYGARAGDVASLKLSTITEEHLTLHVKGNKEHVLPKTPGVRKVLGEWLDIRRTLLIDPPHDFCFVGVHGGHQKLHAHAISLVVRNLSRKCGKNYGAHAIRHWRGQSLADAGITPTTIQYLLGHTDVSITLEHYFNQDYRRVKNVLLAFDVGKLFGDDFEEPEGTRSFLADDMIQ